MTDCWFCGGRMIWDSDFNHDEVFGEGEGVVAMLHCTECGASAWFIQRQDDDQEPNDKPFSTKEEEE